MIILSKFLVTDWFPKGEVAEEQRHISNKFIGLCGKDSGYLNCKLVSLRGASRDAGTDVK
jgi:hypothetical protein